MSTQPKNQSKGRLKFAQSYDPADAATRLEMARRYRDILGEATDPHSQMLLRAANALIIEAERVLNGKSPNQA